MMSEDGVKSVTVNESKKVVTVAFKSGVIRMAKCSEKDEFDPEIGFALCLAYLFYGSKTRFKKELKKIAKPVAKKKKKEE